MNTPAFSPHKRIFRAWDCHVSQTHILDNGDMGIMGLRGKPSEVYQSPVGSPEIRMGLSWQGICFPNICT